jgi:hypothetical protein
MGKDELQAGPELDALVAAKVMGWVKRDEITFEDRAGNRYTTWNDGHFKNPDLPAFSVRVQDAMLVGAEMHRRGFWMRLQSPFAAGGQWSAGFSPGHTVPGPHGNSEYCALGDTPALAICRAALQAMTGTLSAEE